MVVTINLPKQMVDKLKEEKKETGLAVSDLIRRAVSMYFDNRGSEAKK